MIPCWFVLLLAIGVPFAAAAQEAPLALDEVLTSVERSFPLLRAAELEREIARADLLSAQGGFDVSWKTRGTITPVGYYESVRVESTVEQPTSLWGATVFAGYKLGRGEVPLYDLRQQTLEYGELRAGVNVPLWRNGPIDRRRASIGRAELGKDVAELSLAEQLIHYRRAAAHRYWAWVAAGRRLAIARQLLENVEARDAALGARVVAGDLPRFEQVDNERAIEQRRAQLAAARRGLEQAAIELGLFLRDSDGNATVVPASRLPADFPELVDSPIGMDDAAFALARRPEVRRLQLQLRQNEIELGWARNQLAPGIDFQLAGSRDLGPYLTGRPDLSKPTVELTLLLDIPLQTRVMRGRIDAAAATRTRLHYQRAFARERVEADVRDAHSGILGARERIEAARREVRLAIELERGERLRFEQGDSHLLIVNLREQQTAEAELRQVEALLDYHRSVADLRAVRSE